MIELEAVVQALVLRAAQAGWLDSEDAPSTLLRQALEQYTAPTEDELAKEARIEWKQEIDQRIGAWSERA